MLGSSSRRLDPVWVFLGLGLLAWALDPGRRPTTSPREVVEVQVEDHRQELRNALGREPTPAELDAAVTRWLHTEVLVREARRLGLDQTDPVVRERLARKATFVLAALTEPPEPPEALLRAWFEAEAADWRVAEAVTLRQVFAERRDEAEALRLAWEAGADPRELGGPAPGGPVLRARSEASLEASHGAELARLAVRLPVGERTLVASSRGWHVIEVLERREGRALSFEEVRPRLVLRWQVRWQEAATERAVQALLPEVEVVGWP